MDHGDLGFTDEEIDRLSARCEQLGMNTIEFIEHCVRVFLNAVDRAEAKMQAFAAQKSAWQPWQLN